MIRTHRLKNTKFQTITIPKGTLLFRGLSFDDKKKYKSIFHDLIGYQQKKYYEISPTMNVFFYPVPFVSDSVNIYDIHTIYITQYDIELFLFIKPSDFSRENAYSCPDLQEIITICNQLSKTDKCGFEMSKIDPCFTELFMNTFPQIAGYIAIAEQDASVFFGKYKKFVNQGFAKYILSSLVSNSRDTIGIPEIVIHPLRSRQKNCHFIGYPFYNSETIVKYCIKHRGQYNYFPLLYITNTKVYNFIDLTNMNTFKEMEDASRVLNINDPPLLYQTMENVLQLLFISGYSIQNHKYKAYVDVKTGFYRLYHHNSSTKNKSIKRKKEIRRFKDDEFDGNIDSIVSYPNDNMASLFIKSHNNYLDSFLRNLHVNGYAANKHLLFDRGNTNKLIMNYHVDKVLERPDLESFTKRYKRKNNNTKKQNNTLGYMFNFNYDEHLIIDDI
jgi:hypothetical protein